MLLVFLVSSSFWQKENNLFRNLVVSFWSWGPAFSLYWIQHFQRCRCDRFGYRMEELFFSFSEIAFKRKSVKHVQMWHQIIAFLLSFSPLRKPSKDGLSDRLYQFQVDVWKTSSLPDDNEKCKSCYSYQECRVRNFKNACFRFNAWKYVAYKCFSGEAGVGDICAVFRSSSLSLQYSLEDPTEVLPPQPIARELQMTKTFKINWHNL